MHGYEHDGAAWRLLQRVSLDGPVAPSVLAVAHRLGLRLIPGASPCVRGVLWEAQGCVFFDDRAPRVTALGHISHELGHVAWRDWNPRGACAEADIDAIADALQMPGPGMRRAARSVGWDVAQWQLTYPEVALADLCRAAQVLEGVVVLRVGEARGAPARVRPRRRRPAHPRRTRARASTPRCSAPARRPSPAAGSRPGPSPTRGSVRGW
ncbi:MAG: hypothetical protein R3A48_15425 [Polyangiales bacterium]